jgi:hypothetical protein
MNKLDWHKINWKMAYQLIERLEREDSLIWWDLANLAGLKVSQVDTMPNDWTWEHSFKIGLPLIGNKDYLCYFTEDDSYAMCLYDDENTTPCFWDNNEIVYPDAWTDISEEKPITA